MILAEMKNALVKNPGFYVDDCNEINCTRLAEDICDQMDGLDEDDNVPEEYFDNAVIAAEWWKENQ